MSTHFLRVVDIQMIGIEMHLNAFTDQPALHRVGVVVDPDGAAAG